MGAWRRNGSAGPVTITCQTSEGPARSSLEPGEAIDLEGLHFNGRVEIHRGDTFWRYGTMTFPADRSVGTRERAVYVVVLASDGRLYLGGASPDHPQPRGWPISPT